MKYKIHIAAYLEESNQLLVSFSSDATSMDAKDYQSLAFDVVPYGDVSAEEIVEQIAKTAPSVCGDMVVAETYKNDDARSAGLRALVGQSFEFDENQLIDGQAVIERQNLANAEAEEAEEI